MLSPLRQLLAPACRPPPGHARADLHQLRQPSNPPMKTEPPPPAHTRRTGGHRTFGGSGESPPKGSNSVSDPPPPRAHARLVMRMKAVQVDVTVRRRTDWSQVRGLDRARRDGSLFGGDDDVRLVRARIHPGALPLCGGGGLSQIRGGFCFGSDFPEPEPTLT